MRIGIKSGYVIMVAMLSSSSLLLTCDVVTASLPTQDSSSFNLSNKLCPVTGEPVDGKHYCIYNGNQHNLCSGACVHTFSQDPEKYALASKELKEPAAQP